MSAGCGTIVVESSNAQEEYAERFAISRFEQLYPEYVRVFGDPKYGG